MRVAAGRLARRGREANQQPGWSSCLAHGVPRTRRSGSPILCLSGRSVSSPHPTRIGPGPISARWWRSSSSRPRPRRCSRCSPVAPAQWPKRAWWRSALRASASWLPPPTTSGAWHLGAQPDRRLDSSGGDRQHALSASDLERELAEGAGERWRQIGGGVQGWLHHWRRA